MKEDFSKATLKLTMEDLDRPLILLDAFQQLRHEVWRYAPLGRGYRDLPAGYVCNRLAQQLECNLSGAEKLKQVMNALNKMMESHLIEVCPATGNYMLDD